MDDRVKKARTVIAKAQFGLQLIEPVTFINSPPFYRLNYGGSEFVRMRRIIAILGHL